MLREEAIELLYDIQTDAVYNVLSDEKEALEMAINVLKQQSESEIKPIGYRECSNAMLKMWMDNVLTDGEYYRIMNKLNAKWSRILESEGER